MYETIEIFKDEGVSLEEILLSCLFNYYEERYIYCN